MQIAVETQKDGSFLTSLHIAFLSALIALPIFSGFDIFSASRFGVFLLINVICGQYIWSRLVQERKPEVFESLAAGLAIGTSLPALINIGIRLLDLRGFHTAYIFPTLCILFWSFFDRKRPTLSARPASEDDRDFRFIIATPFLAVVAWNPQAWPFCATYLLGIYFFYQKRIGKRITTIPSTRLFATPTILLISLIVNMVYRSLFRDKPLWRYFVGVDGAWDEGTAWSISQFGVKQNALFAGQPFKGHILTQAWAGDIAAATFSPDFLVTGIAGFAVGTLGVSLIVYATSMSLFFKRILAITSLFILYFQASLPEEFLLFPAPRHANSLSILFLIFGWFLLLNLPKWKIKHVHIVIFIATTVVTLSKVHWGSLIVLGGMLLAFEAFMRSKSFVMFFYAANTLAAFLVAYFSFIHGIEMAEKIAINFDFVYLLTILVFVATRLFFSKSVNTSSAVLNRLPIFSHCNLILTVLFVWVTGGENNSFYLLHSAIVLAAIAATPNLESLIIKYRASQPILFYSVVLGFSIGIGTSLAYLYLRYRLANNGQYRILYWLIVNYPVMIQPLTLMVTMAILAVLLLFANRKYIVFLFAPIALSLILGSNLGAWILHPFKPSITNIWHDVNFNSEITFSHQQISAANWIRLNTPADSLIASNFQCTLMELQNSETAKNLDCSNRNTLSWIAPLARRNVLLESITWFQGTPDSPERIAAYEYVHDLDTFARMNDSQSISKLKEYGVDYVVIDRARTTTTSWAPNADVVFENIDYLVLRMVK